MIDERDTVLTMLLDVEKKNTFSSQALSSALRKNQFESKESRSFVTRVFEGTIERKITLDYYLNECSKTKVNKCKPLIRCLLRLTAYQILYMEKVPDSAAINEAVKVAKKHGFGSLSGFVNGVLRTFGRRKEEFLDEDYLKNIEDKSTFLSVKYSTPVWLVDFIQKNYGDKAERILAAGLSERPITLRVNTRKTTKGELIELIKAKQPSVEIKENSLAKTAIELVGIDHPRKLAGYREGLFMVQDASSQAAVLALGINSTDTVYDMCAAPGGKTIFAAELAFEGKVFASDVSEDKVQLIEQNLERLECDNVEAAVWDATCKKDEYALKFDKVICDVPCSGLGIMAKKNDIKYNATPEKMTELVDIQRKILANAICYVKPGGRLLFSTCTINPAENHENLEWILANGGFELIEEKQFLQGIDDCDGFYYAVLVKNRFV